MKVTSITGGSDISLLVKGAKELGIELDSWFARDLEDERRKNDCINSFEDADVPLLRLTTYKVWDEFIEKLNKNVPIILLGRNTFFRSLSNVSLDIAATVKAYHVYGRAENIKNMLTKCPLIGLRIMNFVFDLYSSCIFYSRRSIRN